MQTLLKILRIISLNMKYKLIDVRGLDSKFKNYAVDIIDTVVLQTLFIKKQCISIIRLTNS